MKIILVFVVLTTLSLPLTTNALNPISWAVRTLTRGQEPSFFVRDAVLKVIGRSGSSARSLRTVKAQNRLQEPRSLHERFPCNVEVSPESPRSVHHLRPADVKVIAAMGDSLTAGNGALATTLFQVFTENRGISWSIGGQGDWRHYLTLPNILKEFSPALVGQSLGDGLSHSREAQFNVADSFGLSVDMPHMARVLVRRIRADPRVDFHRDWKVVTLMVGGNDLCSQMCQDPAVGAPWERHQSHLRQALDYLQRYLPRTFVNLAMVPDASIIGRLTGKTLTCRLVNYFECPCLLSDVQRAYSATFGETVRRFQQAEEELVSSGRYDTKDDFTVVLQSFSRNVTFPSVLTEGGQLVTDMSYLSQDCFHFSQKGYSWAANALWNNMLQPVGAKSEGWIEPYADILCPTPERPFFFTALNSNVTYAVAATRDKLASINYATDASVDATVTATQTEITSIIDVTDAVDATITLTQTETASITDATDAVDVAATLTKFGLKSGVIDSTTLKPTLASILDVIDSTIAAEQIKFSSTSDDAIITETEDANTESTLNKLVTNFCVTDSVNEVSDSPNKVTTIFDTTDNTDATVTPASLFKSATKTSSTTPNSDLLESRGNI